MEEEITDAVFGLLDALGKAPELSAEALKDLAMDTVDEILSSVKYTYEEAVV